MVSTVASATDLSTFAYNQRDNRLKRWVSRAIDFVSLASFPVSLSGSARRLSRANIHGLMHALCSIAAHIWLANCYAGGFVAAGC
jgi:hypothetical protein